MTKLEDIIPQRCLWREAYERGELTKDVLCAVCRGYEKDSVKMNCGMYRVNVQMKGGVRDGKYRAS